MDLDDKEVLILKTNDGHDVEVDGRIIDLSDLIKEIVEDAGEDEPIPLPNLDLKTL